MSEIEELIASDDPPPQLVECECCGLTEECTPGYIAHVRGLHGGRWICGLCAEAVKDEIRRSTILITTEEAVIRHATFRTSPPPVDPHGEFISAVRQLFRRSLDSPRGPRSMPSSPLRDRGESGRAVAILRSGSGFFPAMAS